MPASFERFRTSFADAGSRSFVLLETRKTPTPTPEPLRRTTGPDFVLPAPDLGTRLAAVAVQVDGWIRDAPWWSLSHGDFKAGNIFLAEAPQAQVAAIDWQWTGWNMTAHDVLYFLSTSASDDCCEDYPGTVSLYHDAFVAALPEEQRQGRLWPIEEHMRLFQLAALDYMRWAISYRLPSETPAKMRERASAVPLDLNQGEYRRSLKRLSWLLQLVAGFLPAAESGALGEPRAG